jgi:hypothetical protein
MVKFFLKSKTVWVQLIASLASFLATNYGFELPAEQQVWILGVVNIVLRFITKDAISWKIKPAG